jgi:phosphate transport system permease protein
MRLRTRKLLNHALTACGYLAVAVMAFFLLWVLVPVFARGAGAYVFRGTVEHRRMMLGEFGRGDERRVEEEWAEARRARQPVYEAIAAFERELPGLPAARRKELRPAFQAVRGDVAALLGPEPGRPLPALTRMLYGQTRWEKAREKRDAVLFEETWEYTDADSRKVLVPRAPLFEGTALAPLFAALENDLEAMFRPRLTLYPQFLTDGSVDAHFFGGIGPEVLGTVYLALGAMLIAVPLGIVAAVYFQEYAREGAAMTFLRSCVNTLAGVPSVVFGLFGLAFFINTLKVSPGKSVLAGALTLALLVLPTVIRASEEAIAAVPRAYKEGALALGAGPFRTILTVILPAALPGILTGIVISMGRAAGETAPIIFTAAVSVGQLVKPAEVLTQPTPALSWNLYNLCTEHEAVEEIRHVQFGMAATLVLIVLALNLAAILLRARVAKQLKGS